MGTRTAKLPAMVCLHRTIAGESHSMCTCQKFFAAGCAADCSALIFFKSAERQDANPLVTLIYKLAGTHAVLRFVKLMNFADRLRVCVRPYRSSSRVRETRKYRLAIFFVEPFAESLYDPTRQDVGLFSFVFARQAQPGVLVQRV